MFIIVYFGRGTLGTFGFNQCWQCCHLLALSSQELTTVSDAQQPIFQTTHGKAIGGHGIVK
jgi:hypothetical protein